MIKLLVMDVDGTLTDGKIYIGYNGEMMKSFNVKDGLGLKKIQQYGVIPIIITGRKSEILLHRASELSIEDVYQGVINKKTKLLDIVKKYKCEFSEIAYIGDDENDFDCMVLCGLKGCPQDATDCIKNIADFISKKNGGYGAVREFVELILKTNS